MTDDFASINEHIGVTLTIQQALAFRFLERHGMRYLVDFGYENAIKKTRELAKTLPKNRDTILQASR